jgi:hypothetical protein
MKTQEIKNYHYKGALGEGDFNIKVIFDEETPLNDLTKFENVEHSIPIDEIERLEREIALEFFCEKYPQLQCDEYLPSSDIVLKITDILNVNQKELSRILGSHKGTISNILKGKNISVPLALLLFERLATELSFPGITRSILEGNELPEMDKIAVLKINQTRKIAFSNKIAA